MLYQSLNKIKQDENLYQQALKSGDKQKAANLISNNHFKTELGSAVLQFSKIPYSSSNDLVKMALQYRRNLGTGKGTNAGSGSNVAVFEYIGKNGGVAYLIKMASRGKHAEQKIIDELGSLGIPSEQIRRLYSELDTCGNCTKEILEKLKHVKGYYSFELNNKGREVWRSSINKLYNYLRGNK